MSKITVPLPPIERLREVFSIDPNDGRLLRQIPTRKCAVGEEAGYKNNIGYRQVALDGRIYSVHRVAWALYHGSEPGGEVDHINGDRSDNRKENLRIATSGQNNQNRRLSSRNKTGTKCVFKVRWGKSWRWRTAVGHGQKYEIKHFACLGQAVKHAQETRTRLHQEFARAA